jgi:hypothetical protein
MIIKRWLRGRSYSEKLIAILLCQLLGKEHCFRGSDKGIGNQLINEFEESIIEAASSPDYLKSAPPDEAAVTSIVTMMFVWEA